MIETKPCVPENTRVTLLKGGKSGEREVSLDSGQACAQALRSGGFPVVEIDTADRNAIQRILDSNPDVVFIALHGKDGEDGCVQGLCELMDVPYTGPGVLASALAMDKARAKVFYERAGLKTAPWVTVRAGDALNPADIVSKVGESCVVKPTREGSALGVHLIDSPDEIEAAIREALRHDSDVIVEKRVSGMEITVAVLGNENPEALPVIEIVPQGGSEFYDYKAKYAVGGANHIIPARLDESLTEKCQRAAVIAHSALGCTGVSRTDMIVDRECVPWILETNTIPGMTATSLLPDAAARVGLGFESLCRKLVELALDDR